jgi:hypothetical protein
VNVLTVASVIALKIVDKLIGGVLKSLWIKVVNTTYYKYCSILEIKWKINRR